MTAFQTNKPSFFLIIALFVLINSSELYSQPYLQKVSVKVQDVVTKRVLQGAVVTVTGHESIKNSVTGSDGTIAVLLPPGRYTFQINYLGYRTGYIKGIVVGSGKEVKLTTELVEECCEIGQIVVSGKSGKKINPMAIVSAHHLKNEDAARFAGGFYDPLRMVTALPGVSTGNDDANNQISIRGNSPRGLLWKLEGIEIPNPNHLSQGEGGTGGAYSIITTNMISAIDFYTGAFPAEYSNAFSGVMDLSLKTGNASKREYSAGISVVGTELSGEGPVSSKLSGSWIANFRYSNFQILENYGIIEANDLSIIPVSIDWCFKSEISTTGAGTLSFFTTGGSSIVGDEASENADDIEKGIDNEEFLEKKFIAVAGLRHFILFPSLKTNLRTTIGFTYQQTSAEDSFIDNSFSEHKTYSDQFKYPALRAAIQLNHKFNANSSIRAGIDLNFTSGKMFSQQLISETKYDTLLNSRNYGNYGNIYVQWKFRPLRFAELNSGISLVKSYISDELLIEPRLGFTFYLSPDQSLSLSTGLHSKNEALSIYNYRVKVSDNEREESNKNLKTIKALHFTAGYNLRIDDNTRLKVEYYYQQLYDVPAAKDNQSYWSILNYSYGLPDIILDNKGKGVNKGFEYSVEHDYTKGFYYVVSGSFFDARYKAPMGRWFNSYYNNNYVFNLTTGKEFKIGRKKQNIFGLNLKIMSRGGYRYTPVNYDQSISRKRVVYDYARYYGKRLPAYIRNDIGFSYRLNMRGKTLTFLADIQNFTNCKNIIRKKFSYKNGQIIETDNKSIGLVPLLSIKLDF